MNWLRVMSNMSWDEMRFAFRPLQTYAGKCDIDTKVEILLDLVSRFETIFGESYPWPTVCLDVARRLVRQQKLSLGQASLDPVAYHRSNALAHLIRHCPPSLELLSDLRDMLSLAASEHMQSMLRDLIYAMHPVVQWLKVLWPSILCNIPIYLFFRHFRSHQRKTLYPGKSAWMQVGL